MDPAEVVEALCQDWAGGSDALLAEYLDAGAASTVWRWKQGGAIKGPIWLLVRYLYANPAERTWFEEDAARRREIEGKETPAGKRNRARRASYHRSKGKVEGSLGSPPTEPVEPAEKSKRGRKPKAPNPAPEQEALAETPGEVTGNHEGKE